MEIHPIRSEHDYNEALKVISRLVDADPARGTAEGDQLDALAAGVERYEAEHLSLGRPDPAEALKFRVEQSSLTPE